MDPPAVAGLKKEMAQRILVRVPNWVGDAVMAFPFLASLKENAPEATITVLCKRHLAPLFERAHGVNRVIPLDDSRGARGWRSVIHNGSILRKEKFDLAFCLPTSFGSALMLWRARIPRRVGHSAESRGLLLTNSIAYGKDGTRPFRPDGFLALLDLVFSNPVRATSRLYDPGPVARQEVDRIWRQSAITPSPPTLVIAPAAARRNGAWPADRFAAVAGRWIAERSGSVIVLGSHKDRALCSTVAQSAGEGGVWNLAGAGSLTVAAEIIRRSNLFFGNQSGLGHLATAVGTASVIISGPDDPDETAPRPPYSQNVRRPPFCAPCYQNTCWRKDHPLECQENVTVDDVWAHIRRAPQASAI
ncbi:MAG: lipopolysaccharide heptosyltransferase II [candidate division Zixibacteria bacterium]|nr:lipopolysaccharide heptosyltransferase II [candidate division Zixibacteria bacterium]